MQLSQNFTLAELTASATARRLGIDNTPSDTVIVNLLHLCQNLLQPLRDLLGRPLTISSGYRSPALNSAVGGVKNSQHISGEAADIHIPTVTRRRPDGTTVTVTDISIARHWVDEIRRNLRFDQLILEHNAAGTYWIHVSCRRDPARNRGQIIYM